MLAQTKNNIFLFLAMMIILSFSSSFIVHAEQTGTYRSNTIQETNNTGDIANADLPEVTIDEANDWADRKGGEAVGFLQKITKPLAIIAFTISGIIVFFGAFGSTKAVGKGIAGILIIAIVYAAVLSAPELLEFFRSWTSS